MSYSQLPEGIAKRIEDDNKNGVDLKLAFDYNNAIRRDSGHDHPTLLRNAFIRDAEKILHCPFYNRYADKTQVFSFYKNDDITRRALHVQLVSRIARTIGRSLKLDLDLIEAISLGHDIGHTPFGHAGEEFLDGLFYEYAGRHFSHNIHSVRVLDEIFPLNLTLQTLNGIASHDGEMELPVYTPREMNSFCEFDKSIEDCYIDKANVKKLIPSTLEGCVVRISDIIAYLGKDRQDAERADVDAAEFEDSIIGKYNSVIINNLTVNIVANSYGAPYIKMDDDHFEALKKAKSDNYARIYKADSVKEAFDTLVRPMMREIFEKLLDDLLKNDKTSPIFRHHISFVDKPYYAEKRRTPYESTPPEQIVVDYIASMTDDYFIDLHSHLFPDSKHKIDYIGYFD
ncbi:MAG: HD domain-containing protein [Ruminococcaceae bacterium]|nr:HD domain-containing protein [Oscillospiraceae bacterium]